MKGLLKKDSENAVKLNESFALDFAVKYIEQIWLNHLFVFRKENIQIEVIGIGTL